MKGPYFRPWKGSNYESTRLLILSESAYSWRENGKRVDPGPSHPTFQILRSMENFGKQKDQIAKYYKAMSRALCNKEDPTYDELFRAWSDWAYSIFVQSTVGLGPENRPTNEQFIDAKPYFRSLLERIRPNKIVVTGKTMWNQMPDCDGLRLCDDLQAYKLSDGALVWCLALPHPSRGIFQWKWAGEYIRTFRSIKLPLRG